MKFDMHCHTREGSIDAKVGIESYINKLIHLGYDGMLVTDHNSYKGYVKWKESMEDSNNPNPFTVLKGIEYDTRNAGHMIVILPENVRTKLLEIRGMTVQQLEKIVHGLGGILGPAHPYGTGFFAFMNTRFGKKNLDFLEKFDFIETFNACTKPLANVMAKILAQLYGKPNIAGSDAHKEHVIGSAFTIFEDKITNNDELISAIKRRSCTVADGTILDSMKKKKSYIIEKLGIWGYWLYNKAGAVFNYKRRKKQTE